MLMFGKYRIVIIVIVVLGIGFLIFASTRKSDDVNDALAEPLARSNTEILGAEIISALNQIESLRLSREIFTDPVFLSLTDRSETIPPEPVGKRNPFDPISSRVTPTQTAPATTTVPTTPRNNIIRPPAEPVI